MDNSRIPYSKIDIDAYFRSRYYQFINILVLIWKSKFYQGEDASPSLQ